MDERILKLKMQMSQMREDREQGGRWQSAVADKPISNYANTLLKTKRAMQATFNKSTERPQSGSRPSSASKVVPKLLMSKNNLNMQKIQFLKRPSSGSKRTEEANRSSQSINSSINSSVNKSITSLKSVVSTPRTKPSNAIVDNLKRALLVQKDLMNDVVQYLTAIDLGAYAGVMLQNGFDDLETLQQISIPDLQRMRIPVKEGKLLLRKLSKRGKDKQLIAAQQKEQEVSQDKTPKRSLFDGTFDEKQSHDYFLEALMAFRGGKSMQQPVSTKKEVRFEEPSNNKENSHQPKKSILKQNDEGGVTHISSKTMKKKLPFFMETAAMWSNDNYPSNQDTDVQTAVVQKSSCWTCYKVQAHAAMITYRNETYCSQTITHSICLLLLQRVCTSNHCMANVSTLTALQEFGMWFCDSRCLNTYQLETKTIDTVRSKGKQSANTSINQFQRDFEIDLELADDSLQDHTYRASKLQEY